MIIQAVGYSKIPGKHGVSSEGDYLHHQCKCFPFGGGLNLTLGQNKGKGKVHPCIGTVALYRPYCP
jgi:hypothetical protein